MTAAVYNPVVAEATTTTTSTFDQIKEGLLNSVNWMGRQIQWLGSTLKDFAFKVVEFVKPFFQSIGKMLAETYDKIREFIIANKEVSTYVGIAAVVGAALFGLSYFICCDSSSKEGEKKAADDKKPEVEPAAK
ncbi:MAG: hypothetical protein KR126chlam3_00934 [Chlamydiae bacterium]|nr:hypothetical protein [Chlamydiota bacterium]